MGYIFLGHGDLTPPNVAYDQGMDTVAVPPGTSVQFFSDFGQGLVVTTNLLTSWSQLRAPWPPLDETKVTYNLELSAFEEKEDPKRFFQAAETGAFLAGSLDAPGHEVRMPGINEADDLLLCTGNKETCPTNPRDRRAHSCDGILGRFQGDLYWVACTSLSLPRSDAMLAQTGMTEETVAATRQLLADARGSSPTSVTLGANPDDLLDSARRLIESTSPERFVVYFYDEINDQEREAIRACPELAAVIDKTLEDHPELRRT